MDSVKQVDEAIAVEESIQANAPSLGVWRACNREFERLGLIRMAIRSRTRREVDALRWIAYEAPDKAKMQETIAEARFVALKSGDGLAVLLANYKTLRGI